MSGSEEWINKLFIEKADLFLKVLNERWKNSEEEAGYIIKLLDKLEVSKDAQILEVGCGNGRIVINLAKHGYVVYGIDISPVLIDDAKKKAVEHSISERVKFYVGDARKLGEIFPNKKFNVIIMVWSSVLGYYTDENIDIEILRQCRLVSDDDGYLLILNTANRDYIAFINSVIGVRSFVEHLDEDTVLIENPCFDHKTSIITNTWQFYRKMENKDLKFIDEVSFKFRVYSLHEVIKLAEQAGWQYVEAYKRLSTLEPFTPTFSGLNIVFKAR